MERRWKRKMVGIRVCRVVQTRNVCKRERGKERKSWKLRWGGWMTLAPAILIHVDVRKAKCEECVRSCLYAIMCICTKLREPYQMRAKKRVVEKDQRWISYRTVNTSMQKKAVSKALKGRREKKSEVRYRTNMSSVFFSPLQSIFSKNSDSFHLSKFDN